MRGLNDSSKEVLKAYQERFFNKFFDDFLQPKPDIDYEKLVDSILILEEVIDCENKDTFPSILGKISNNYENQKYINDFYALFNRCNVDNFEEELPEEVSQMIDYCVQVSTMNKDEAKEGAAQYFRSESKKYLEEKKCFLMVDGKILTDSITSENNAVKPSSILSRDVEISNYNEPSSTFQPSSVIPFPTKNSVFRQNFF